MYRYRYVPFYQTCVEYDLIFDDCDLIYYKQVTPVATREKHLTTVVEETPAAPSLVPRPTSQPRQVSPAGSLVPTPEGLFLSCVITDGSPFYAGKLAVCTLLSGF